MTQSVARRVRGQVESAEDRKRGSKLQTAEQKISSFLQVGVVKQTVKQTEKKTTNVFILKFVRRCGGGSCLGGRVCKCNVKTCLDRNHEMTKNEPSSRRYRE